MNNTELEFLDSIRAQRFKFGKDAVLSLGTGALSALVAVTESSIPAGIFAIAATFYGGVNICEWDQAVKHYDLIHKNIDLELKAISDSWQTE